ncbi:MAG TPA: hypothetical protein VGJ84_03535 [Polyangiaceae bacterium]|jgi:hypothetical protein
MLRGKVEHLTLSFLTSAFACAGSGGTPKPASMSAHSISTPKSTKAPPKRERWDEFQLVQSWPPVNGERFIARDHLPNAQKVEVRVDEASRKQYLSLVTDTVFKVGTLVAASHFDAGSGAPGPIYVMHKEPSGWNYFVVQPDATKVARADTQRCARCHSEAAADSLFGLPRVRESNGAVGR